MGAPHRTAPHAAGAFCGRERPGGFFIRVPASATHIYYIQYARRQWVIVGMRAAAHDLQRRWESGGSVRALPAFAARRRPPTRPFPSLPREGKLREGSDCDGIHQPGSLGLGCARATTGVGVSAYADRAGHIATNGGSRNTQKERKGSEAPPRAPSSICFFVYRPHHACTPFRRRRRPAHGKQMEGILPPDTRRCRSHGTDGRTV
jgi:hypothetical protein